MLSLAKLEGLSELVATTEFDLIPTLNRLIKERSPTIETQQIKIIYPTQKHFICTGDKILISQAVANLLDNAISFCKRHGSVEINLRSKQSDDLSFEVTIFNQGTPIPEFALDKIYDRFFSLPRPTETQNSSKSTGLGLSFVQEIMNLHNGKVVIVNSKHGVTSKLSW
jgi:two-component system sensor histidine kinase CreC